MPFKTKKQKLAAERRRFTFSPGGSVVYNASSNENKSAVLESGDLKGSKETKGTPTPGKYQIENLGYIRGDLIKIALAASFIIMAQLALGLTLP